MAREAVIPPSQGCTVSTAGRDTTRPEPTPRKFTDASTQAQFPEPVTKLWRREDESNHREAWTPDGTQNFVAAKWTEPLPSTDPNEATTYIARTDEDLIPALHLISDSVAQQRQIAARSLLLHPVCWLPIIASIPYLIVERAHDSSDWLVILIIIACIMTVVMTIVKIIVRGYLDEAEKVGRWSWLYGHRWIKTRMGNMCRAEKAGRHPRDERDDYVFITRLGKEVIGAVVLRIIDTWERDTDPGFELGREVKRRHPMSYLMNTYHRKKVCIRAWTVKRQYRGQGIGHSLLGFVVRWALNNDLEFIFFADDHAHSLRVLPRFLNKDMDRQDDRAKNTLYWEVKHYSTPWHMEQRKERKMLFHEEVKARLADVKDRTPYRDLSPQRDVPERRGRLASKSSIGSLLDSAVRADVQPSISSWLPGKTNVYTPSPEPVMVVQSNDYPMSEHDTDNVETDTVNFTESDGGSGVEENEIPTEEEFIQHTIDESCMGDSWHGPQESLVQLRIRPFNAQANERRARGASTEPNTFNIKSENAETSHHDLHNHDQARDKADAGAPSTPTIGDEAPMESSTPPHCDRILRRSANKPDHAAHLSCESCGCTVDTNNSISMENVSPPGTWFHHENQLCSSCGLKKIRKSIDRFDKPYVPEYDDYDDQDTQLEDNF